jgi:hypothetical protein
MEIESPATVIFGGAASVVAGGDGVAEEAAVPGAHADATVATASAAAAATAGHRPAPGAPRTTGPVRRIGQF